MKYVLEQHILSTHPKKQEPHTYTHTCSIQRKRKRVNTIATSLQLFDMCMNLINRVRAAYYLTCSAFQLRNSSRIVCVFSKCIPRYFVDEFRIKIIPEQHIPQPRENSKEKIIFFSSTIKDALDCVDQKFYHKTFMKQESLKKIVWRKLKKF